jgi:hypothetical protein
MKIGIVGHGKNKFTKHAEQTAKNTIRNILLAHSSPTLISGHSPVGGIDIWAEEIAIELGIKMDIKTPRQKSWEGEYGYKARNLDIAQSSDEIHVILVDEYPKNYKGIRFTICYHCAKHPGKVKSHVKSGGCWTGWKAYDLGKDLTFHIIKNNEQQNEE